MGKNINPDDTRLKWKGAVSTELTTEGVMPWRIPFTQKDLFAWQLIERAAMPAGVRLEFGSNTSYLEMFFDSIPDRSPVDIFCDGELQKEHVYGQPLCVSTGKSLLIFPPIGL